MVLVVISAGNEWRLPVFNMYGVVLHKRYDLLQCFVSPIDSRDPFYYKRLAYDRGMPRHEHSFPDTGFLWGESADCRLITIRLLMQGRPTGRTDRWAKRQNHSNTPPTAFPRGIKCVMGKGQKGSNEGIRNQWSFWSRFISLLDSFSPLELLVWSSILAKMLSATKNIHNVHQKTNLLTNEMLTMIFFRVGNERFDFDVSILKIS